MEYNKIIAVTGLPGLFELLSSKSDGAIVRSLDDKVTRFVASRVHNFSHLESIEIYTVRENVNLVDVLQAMEASGEKLPDEKDNAALKSYFSKVYPDMDFERVYTSDLKKMVKWFSVLKANDIEIKLSEGSEEEVTGEEVEAPEASEVAEKPKAAKNKAAAADDAAAAEKPAKAKKSAAAEKEQDNAADEEKPKAKKAAPKKKAEEKSDDGGEADKPKKTAAKKKS